MYLLKKMYLKVLSAEFQLICSGLKFGTKNSWYIVVEV